MANYINFEVAALQTRTCQLSLTDAAERDRQIRANIARICDLIDYVTSFGNSEVKLVVTPEYSINANFRQITLEQWMEISTTIPGPYTDILCEKAKQRKIYLACNMLEVHPDFPRRFFNCSFLISPEGKIVIKHWKMNNNCWVFPYTTPADIYTEFCRKYGREALFQVAKTEIGNIGLITCGELGFPENARCTMMNGAEILCHLTSEPNNMSHGDVRNWKSLRTARAYENKAYLVAANIGQYEGALRGLGDSHGDSAVHYFDGTILNTINGPGEASIKGPINLNDLRRARSKPFHPTVIRAELYAKEYASWPSWPNDGFADKPIESIQDTRAIFHQLVKKRQELGIDRPAQNFNEVD
ncbi:MAG: nitrilase-related carbon-nitrogen hydrolase [Alphaproteobacteria bacterium]